ncbi:MAG: type II toxin-antitoxin system VapC family toxin [Candidatus Caldarchaeales archaeon]
MIVIDASSLVKYILHEEGWDRISQYLKREEVLYSLDHMLKEVVNALWKHCIVKNLISRDTAIQIFKSLARLVDLGMIVLEHEEAYLERAVTIALDNSISIYDALYLAQAERFGGLVTSDKEQAEIARAIGIPYVDLIY